MMRWIRWTMLALVLVGTTSAWAQPTTQPNERRGPRGNPGPGVNGVTMPPGRFREPPSAEEWAEVSEFMKANSPHRFEVFNKFVEANKDRTEFINRMKARINGRYQALKDVQMQNPDRYAQLLEAERDVDALWGIALKATASDSSLSEAQHAAVEAELRKELSAYFHKMIDQKQTNLDERRKKLEGEQAQLDSEKQQLDTTIDQRVQQMLSGHLEPGLFDGFGGSRRQGRNEPQPPPPGNPNQ